MLIKYIRLIMSDLIRCPACRGAKKVPKLGGMIGECNTCEGSGKIKAVDKPKPVTVEPVIEVNEVIAAVSNVADIVQPEPVDIKAVAKKRAVFTRKK
jgi:DnaJ-class molecular chaperone